MFLQDGDVFGVWALLGVERAAVGGKHGAPGFVVAGGMGGQDGGGIGVARAGAAARLRWLGSELCA